MKLICYLMDRAALDIRPAGLSREWMDQSIDRFAYRCLPLNIANSHGWEICCEESFEAVWNGGIGINDVVVNGCHQSTAVSHFGSGVLTFHVSCIFRTEPNWQLMVMGPPNRPKRGIQALTGVIETDWSPYSFTMNWIFTEPNHTIKFMKGEPFCFFFPFPYGLIDNTDPEFQNMRSNQDLYTQHSAWIASRQNFINDLATPESTASQEKWQRKYFHGLQMNGQAGTLNHQTKIRPKPFKLSLEQKVLET